MTKCRLSPLAERDLEEIWLYTYQHWSVEQADHYCNNIIADMEQLAAGIVQGRIDSVRDGYLKYRTGRHYIAYSFNFD